MEARRAEFKKIDTDGNGAISFDEWLMWANKHIMKKVTHM